MVSSIDLSAVSSVQSASPPSHLQSINILLFNIWQSANHTLPPPAANTHKHNRFIDKDNSAIILDKPNTFQESHCYRIYNTRIPWWLFSIFQDLSYHNCKINLLKCKSSSTYIVLKVVLEICLYRILFSFHLKLFCKEGRMIIKIITIITIIVLNCPTQNSHLLLLLSVKVKLSWQAKPSYKTDGGDGPLSSDN